MLGSYALGEQALGGLPDTSGEDHILTATPGAYALTGYPAVLTRTRRTPAAAGSYALSGHASGLVATRSLSTDAGNYVLTGHTASPRAARFLRASTDSGEPTYRLSGQPVQFRAPRFSVPAGAYVLSGHPASLLHDRRLPCQPGTYVLMGGRAYSGRHWAPSAPFIQPAPDYGALFQGAQQFHGLIEHAVTFTQITRPGW